VIVLVRIMDGQLKKGDVSAMMQKGRCTMLKAHRVFAPAHEPRLTASNPGEIGSGPASIKQVRDTRVGDTITHEKKGTKPRCRL